MAACLFTTHRKGFPSIQLVKTHIGDKERNRHKSKKLNVGRDGAGKSIVIGIKGKGGGVKAKKIKNSESNTLRKEIKKVAIRGSALY